MKKKLTKTQLAALVRKHGTVIATAKSKYKWLRDRARVISRTEFIRYSLLTDWVPSQIRRMVKHVQIVASKSCYEYGHNQRLSSSLTRMFAYDKGERTINAVYSTKGVKLWPRAKPKKKAAPAKRTRS